MYSNIILHRQWSKLACLCRSLSTIEGQKLPQVGKSSDGITPPPRIPRGPTDILQALASTVGTDPTAAHYKYHDDPYLIPLSNFRKRSYALSAEAGRKAAAWVRDEHAELFTTREWDPPMKMKTEYYNADPQIDMYAPRPIYNDESKVTEEDLKYTINNALLEDAIKVFHLLGGVEGVNDELKLSLLQFLCFYNQKEPVSMEWIEERWFSAATKERQAATWKLGGLADKIFEAMDPKTPEAYCAIIQGMAKYYQAERAHVLAKEAIEKGIPLSTSVYNSLLGCVGFLKEGTVLRIEALKSLLGEMNQQGFTPNKETLNSCLSSISLWGSGKPLQTVALQILAEFRQLNIQPTLSSYYYLLCIFCKERGPRVDILTPILNDLEKRESLEATDATDTNFFITAMGVCSNHLQDVSLAERLHALLMKDDNYKLVGDAYKESIYYRHLVTVTCRFAPFDKAMQLLDILIPNVYVPEPSVMEEIIKTLELNGCGERLVGAWSQLVVFGLAPRTRLVERLLTAVTTVYAGQDDETKTKIRAMAADIVKFDQIKEEKDQNDDKRTPSPKLSATALTNILELCSDTTDKDDPNWEMVENVVHKLRSEQTIGVPSNPQAIADVAEKAATVGLPSLASLAVTYLAECGFEEAGPASERALGVLLNRPPDEVRAILEQKASPALHPDAMQIVDAYHLAKTGSSMSSSDGTSSDSDSSSDDE
ncbi:protein PTCD3 homolog, mitochondrial-like [Aricia agestis]|uniref:protein PTCD3 homolog, mitochondrial-like n=1 Tax=Aricia agestis TaxID=91739 RepID=UPI001C2071B5|nr:protein PTCD3 homolog, mitochondrial-like [Aricia agestis]